MKSIFRRWVNDRDLLAYECAKFRRSLHYTQTEVARELGVSQSVVARFEAGESSNAKVFCWYLDRGFLDESVRRNA